jgi:flagellar biosynthesis protein FliQ
LGCVVALVAWLLLVDDVQPATAIAQMTNAIVPKIAIFFIFLPPHLPPHFFSPLLSDIQSKI